MNDANARQQIVEKIQDSSNILVTVSKDPSVDELSAALGLTVMLNNMNKHATAVFSGAIPPAIEFLNPGKTFENTVDSLRDFIIALDKEKADHLRYKVDGDVVKIFITPYRTTIGEKDLEFSQGDYNVELVLALGVTSQEHLDAALEAHGRIFHDATVATVTVGGQTSELGSLGWNERSASSLSELMVGLSDALRTDKSLLDEQTATAFLTGIVATTDRFSNNLTSSKVMTIAAQLMAAGANQQLIATKLEEAHEIKQDSDDQNADGSTNLSEGKSSKVKKNKDKSPQKLAKQPETEPKKESGAGELLISHEKQGSLDEVSQQTEEEQLDKSTEKAEEALAQQLPEPTEAQTPLAPADETKQPEQKNAEQELEDQLASIANQPKSDTLSVADLQKDLAAASADVDKAATEPVNDPILPPPTGTPERDEPSLGGTLNATTEEAAEEKRREEKNDQNRTILSHEGNSYMGNQTPTYNAPLNSTLDPNLQEQKPLEDPMSGDTQPTAPAPIVTPPASAGMTLAQLDQENRSPHDEARSAIDAAFASQPAAQSAVPQSDPSAASQPTAAFGSATSGMPPLPDFSTLPPLPPQFSGQQVPVADPYANLGGAQSQPAQDQTFSSPQPSATPAPGSVSDPGQFKIPGQ